jgi:hypothetical protein
MMMLCSAVYFECGVHYGTVTGEIGQVYLERAVLCAEDTDSECERVDWSGWRTVKARLV